MASQRTIGKANRFSILAIAIAASISLSHAAYAGGALTEQDVKTVIEKVVPTDKFVWQSVQIAPARKASVGEISSCGLPPNCTITPVKASFKQYTGQGPWLRDHVQNYLFYKDDFGAWAEQMTSVTGNYTSEPHQ